MKPVPPPPVAVKVPGEVPEQMGVVPCRRLYRLLKHHLPFIVVVDVLTVPHVPLVTAQ